MGNIVMITQLFVLAGMLFVHAVLFMVARGIYRAEKKFARDRAARIALYKSNLKAKG